MMKTTKKKNYTKLVYLGIMLCFAASTVQATPAPYNLPAPTQFVPLSKTYSEPVLKGLKIDPNDPFKFEFIVDTKNKKDVSREDFITMAELTKKYLLYRYKFGVHEITTEEFIERIQGVGGNLIKKYGEFLATLLRRADLAKFAGSELTPEEKKKGIETMTEFLKEYRPLPEQG